LPAIFYTDLVVVSVAAWLVVCAADHAERGFLESALAWLWAFTALVAASGIVLGIMGGFGPAGFLALHAAALAILAAARRRHLADDGRSLRLAAIQARTFFNSHGGERLLGLGLFVILAALTLVAVWAQPAVLDALTYHLPRLGQWLQDGRISVLATPDDRMNFVAAVPEIVMAWLVGGVREGFRMAVVAQAIGGIMTVGATIGLARQTGLSRSAALLAGILLLGMADVAVQFTAAQTDLFTTGVFSVSLYLWLAALKRGRISVLGCLGAGLALGAKGTVCYLAPGALVWVVWLAWKHRLPWSQWKRTILAGGLGIAIFALPGFVRNWEAYGGALGPEVWVKKHHQGFDSFSGQAHKLYWNLTAALSQNLDPQSQPIGLRSASRAAGLALVNLLPAGDPYTLRGIDRISSLLQVLGRSEPDVDANSFGVVALVLFTAGWLIALFGGRSGQNLLVLVWATGVSIFFLFFYVMQQWHPFGFRYLLLGTPWIAVVGAWGIEQLAGRLRTGAWVVVTLASLDVCWHVTTHTAQAGWQSVVAPGNYVGYYVASGWRDWSEGLDHADAPYLLALPEERPLAGFYRQWPDHAVTFKADPGTPSLTAEAFVRGDRGWVIVPAMRFVGKEGHVAVRVWLLDGDETSPYSVAAYRALDAGEREEAAVYRQRRSVTPTAVNFDFLIRAAGKAAVRLALANPSGAPVTFTWQTPRDSNVGRIEAGSRTAVTLPLTDGKVDEVRVAFQYDPGHVPGAPLPTAQIAQ
jgi:hypothetical protein